MEDLAKREKTAREIARTQASIRKKHRALKTGRMESEIALEKQYKPIIEPLKQIAEITTDIKKEESPLITPKLETPFTKLLEKKRKHETSPEDKNEDAADVKKRTSLKAKRLRRQRVMSDASFFTPKRIDALKDVGRRRLQTEEQENINDNDGIFQTPQVPPREAPVTRTPTMSEIRGTFVHKLGPLGQKYMDALLSGNINIDYVYGVYFADQSTGPATTMLGDKVFILNTDDSIVIDGMTYMGTPGLYALIFTNKPQENEYTNEDLLAYRNILMTTNAYRRGHSGQVVGSKGFKYKYIIGPLIRGEIPKVQPVTPRTSTTISKKKGGSVIPHTMRVVDNKIDYIHWDDPNELADRLRLLVESREAGNNAHENEMLSIIEELREAGVIL